METETSQDWLGTSLSDIYKGQGPWNFRVPPVIPSKSHTVLYEVQFPEEGPPHPHFNANPNHWDDDHVRMPYSPNSLFVVEEEGQEVIKQRWDVITAALLQPIRTSQELEDTIHSYNTRLPKFHALHCFFEQHFEEEESQYFFERILPEIVKLALRLPELLPGSLPILKKDQPRSVSLSQLQIASLMANGFLCTFIHRKDLCPGANFIRLFASNGRRDDCIAEKLKCIIHYFRTVILKVPTGCLTFKRKFIPRKGMPRWDAVNSNLGNTKIHVSSSGTIEDCAGLLQADFANKNIGGGVLGYGCVQEEIRFVICPELIISRLFVEQLGDNEAVHIIGAERYSNYSGYGDSFTWEGKNEDNTPMDEYRRKRTSIVVIDATHFNRPKDQFHPSAILRELNKAYVGFSSKEKTNLAAVATGNWGCGAFKGDPHLKSLIQLMACSAANRDLVYFSFGNVDLRDDFYNMHVFLATHQITICQLWRYLCRFCAANVPHDQLYSYIQQSHFDAKSQPTLKQYFTFKPKKDAQQPSSSSSEPNVAKHASETKVSKTPPALSPPKVKTPALSPPKVKSPALSPSPKVKTPPETSPKKAKPKQEKENNSSDEERVRREVFEAIARLDSENVAPKMIDSSNGFLSEIDKLKRVKAEKKSDDFVMDIDVEPEPEPEPMVVVAEERKRKITDYFKKSS